MSTQGDAVNEAQMRSLVCAIDRGSINAAARDLFITAPSLHQRLGTLEAELGCKLLERDGRGVRATKAGARMYAAFVACLDQLDAARDDIGAAQSACGPVREVRIGVSWRPALQTYYAIEALREQRPELAVRAVKVTGKSLADALIAGDIDLFEGPRLTQVPDGCAYHPLGCEDYRCVCGPESRWARCETVTLGMLERATVYAGSDFRAYRSYRDSAEMQRFYSRENFKATPYPTEQIVADCMSGNAVVLFPASRANDLCPPLVHTALAMPPVETGAYTRTTPTEDVLAVIEELRAQIK